MGDLATSRQLSKLAKEGAFTVLLNPQQAHAEQTIHEDFRLRDAEFQAKFPHRPIDPAKRKIAGTFIRCGACGGEIGPDEEQTHIHDESEPATAPHLPTHGRSYVGKARLTSHRKVLKAVGEKKAVQDAKRTPRPRSRSPSPAPDSDED